MNGQTWVQRICCGRSELYRLGDRRVRTHMRMNWISSAIRQRALAPFLFSVAMLGLSSGCSSPQSWTTARTLNPGDVQHGIGVEVIGRQFTTQVDPDADGDPDALPELNDDDSCAMQEDCEEIIFVPVPTIAYGVRVGALPRLEFGAKVNTGMQLQGDVKVQLVRRRFFDLALNPQVATAWTFDRSDLRLHGLFSLNLGRRFTLTAAPQTGLAISHPTKRGRLGETVAGATMGMGLAAQLRFRRVSLTPSLDAHFTRWQDHVVRDQDMVLAVGLAIGWGDMPDYGLRPRSRRRR